MTDVENRLWWHLRQRQIFGNKFRRQHPIGNYVVDFVCLEKKLIIEIDGGQHAEQTDYDSRRSAFLKNKGFRILRFWNNQVLEETEGVLEQILNELPPHLDLPPAGAGGRKRSGFTLVELIIVISLMLTLAGLATTAFARSFQARSIDHFVKELTAFLRYLQFHAIEAGATYQLVVDPELGTLMSFVQDEESKLFEEFDTPYTTRFQRTRFFSLDLDSGHEVYFFPDGTVTRNRFFISTNGERKATVEIKNRIGAFRVAIHG